MDWPDFFMGFFAGGTVYTFGWIWCCIRINNRWYKRTQKINDDWYCFYKEIDNDSHPR
jgi:hypothetical protein